MAKKKDNQDPLLKIAQGSKGSRAQRLGALVVGAKKKYGHSVLSKASKTEALIVPRVSSGVFGVDLRTNGGLPLRRVVMIYGPKSGGKTTMYLRGMAEAQKLCANCCQPGEFEDGVIELPDLETGEVREVETQVITSCPCGKPRDFLAFWMDAEGVWDVDWAIRNGVWAEKVILMRPAYGEQGYDMATAMINSGEIDLIVLDSIAAMTPRAEFEASMEQSLQGPAARMNNRFLRKIVGGMNMCFQQRGHTPGLWLVNQYREKIGVLFGSPEVLPGGKGQGFATSLEIECRPGKVNKDEDSGETLDAAFKYNVKKSKVGVAHGSGEYKLCMADTDIFSLGDVLDHEEVIQFGVDMGFVDKPNNTMYGFNGEKFRGKGQIVLHLAEHPGEYEFLKQQILAQRLGYRLEEGDEQG